jgi:TonB family protein
MDVRRPRSSAVPLWLVASLFVHGGLAVGATYVHFSEFTSTAPTPLSDAEVAALNATPIDLTMVELPATTAEREQQIAAQEEKKIEEKKAEQEQEEEKAEAGDTVVDVPRPEVEVRPDKTEHRAEFDSTVAKETVRHGMPVPSGVGTSPGKDPNAVSNSAEAQQASRGGQKGAPGAATAVGPQASAAGGGRVASSEGEKGSALGFDASTDGNQAKRGKGLGVTIDPIGNAPPGGDGGDGRPRTDLRPSGDALARVATGTYDKLDDIDEGEDTLLNTKRFKYASFFNRVKRAVWENWHADHVYALRDPDGRIYGIKDRLTVLKVSLRADGSLANVIVEKPCGVDFLDDEAVSAFKKAQPFPNPPKGLVDEASKLITFRFGFTLEIADRPSWKIVKYQ